MIKTLNYYYDLEFLNFHRLIKITCVTLTERYSHDNFAMNFYFLQKWASQLEVYKTVIRAECSDDFIKLQEWILEGIVNSVERTTMPNLTNHAFARYASLS